MKRGVVLLVLVLLIGVTVSAQGYIYNPSNTPSSGGGPNSWPFSVYSAWKYQFIVNASVLPSAPFKIIDIAFAPTSSRTFTANPFEIRMGHTTYTAFGPLANDPRFVRVLGSCPTVCYTGPISWVATANSWSPIGLQRSFGYDGKRNICVEIRYRATGSQGVACWTDTTINRAYTHTGYSADPYNEPKWQVPIPGEAMGNKHRLTYVKDNILFAPDTLQIGTSGAISYGNGPAGDFYQIAASLGQSVQWHFGNCSIFLDPDGVFMYSVLFGVPIFNGYNGMLSAAGGATGKFAVPALKQLVGICVFHAAVAYNKGGVTGCTNTAGTLLVP